MEQITKYAIEQAGGAAKLSREVGLTLQAVCAWKRIPPKHVRTVARITGIPPSALRPDIFGDAA
jgi:DNA-binding transcriptional regulator YdaS (Cro superfamily)